MTLCPAVIVVKSPMVAGAATVHQVAVGSLAAIATLDARNAQQQFGGRSRTEELLAKIEDNTKKAADAKGGIPVV